jgi:hypothetical protein
MKAGLKEIQFSEYFGLGRVRLLEGLNARYFSAICQGGWGAAQAQHSHYCCATKLDQAQER